VDYSIVIVIIVAIVFLIVKVILDSVSKAELLYKKIALEKEKIIDLKISLENDIKQKEYLEKSVNKLSEEKTDGFPWLAEAFAELQAIIDEHKAVVLETKKRPAFKASEVVREIKNEKKVLNRENKRLNYIIKYYESLFPRLVDFRESDIPDDYIRVGDKKNQNEENNDSVRNWISEGEYNSLTNSDRNQRALERYIKRHKSKLEIGLAYERFIGYEFERDGYSVNYFGIKKGFDDLGIDLICKKNNLIVLVQCKNWSIHKEIHENVVNQLFGTTFKYCYDNVDEVKNYIQFNKLLENGIIKPMIYTSTNLSERAKEFARVLKVVVCDNYKMEDYPLIKCNLSKNKEKIYHLPFDQQYDNINMYKSVDTFYVSSVKEAEGLGYRRAFRWKGNRTN